MLPQVGSGTQSVTLTNQTINSSYSAGDFIGVYKPKFEQMDGYANLSAPFGMLAANQVKTSQQIVIPYGINLTSITVMLLKAGSPTNNTIIRIETDNAGSPSGTLANINATATISNSTLTTSAAYYTISFASNFILPSGTYHVVYTVDTGNSNTNFIYSSGDSENYITTLFPIIQQVIKYYNGTSWLNLATSYMRLQLNASTPSLVKIQAPTSRLFMESFSEILGIAQSSGSEGSITNIKTLSVGLKDTTVSGLIPLKYSSLTLGETSCNYAWNDDSSKRTILYNNRDATLMASKTRYIRYTGNDNPTSMTRVLTYGGKGVIKSLFVNIQGVSSTNTYGYMMIIDGVTVMNNTDSVAGTGIVGYLSIYGSGTAQNRYTLQLTGSALVPNSSIDIPFESSIEIYIINGKTSPSNDIRLNIDSQ